MDRALTSRNVEFAECRTRPCKAFGSNCSIRSELHGSGFRLAICVTTDSLAKTQGCGKSCNRRPSRRQEHGCSLGPARPFWSLRWRR